MYMKVFRPRSYLWIIGNNLLSENTVATKAARQRGEDLWTLRLTALKQILILWKS